jgi:feruloyl esterase
MKRCAFGFVVAVVLAATVSVTRVTAAPLSCGDLAATRLKDGQVLSADLVDAGQFVPPAGVTIAPDSIKGLPAFCRVSAKLTSSPDSDIRIEVWLPRSGWNGRYMGIGNGGAGGFINYVNANGPSLASALRDGFATSSTDTGHRGANDDFSFGRDHREQRIDYHYRAVHETALAAKGVIRAFYGGAPHFSYFSGCSDGGRQGLIEAQRYPADYDGVLVCGPAVNRTGSLATQVWVAQAVAAEPRVEIAQSTLSMVHAAVLASCDSLDGVQDGLIDEPAKCHFDPASLVCTGLESDRCLSPAQVTVLKRFYSGPRNSNGETIGSGFLPGAETDPDGVLWSCWNCKGSAFHRASIVFQGMFDAHFAVNTFNFDRDLQALEKTEDAKLTNANDPNLKPFMDRGGKLIIVHGWSDAADPAMLSVKYYEHVVSVMGADTAAQFFRLYMTPGVYHNASHGPGPTAFPGPMLRALEAWVENKTAPEAVVATTYETDGDPSSGILRTRPLCPYPQVARYRGSGNIDAAASSVCRVP